MRPAPEQGNFLAILVTHNDIIKTGFVTAVPLRRDCNNLIAKLRRPQKFDRCPSRNRFLVIGVAGIGKRGIGKREQVTAVANVEAVKHPRSNFESRLGLADPG
jgi:hypothetical protein